MKKIIALVMLFTLPAVQLVADEQTDRAEQSRAAIKVFVGGLKGELKGALKEGGPVKAINVCNAKAQNMAQDVSNKYGWQISRTTLKPRNQANAPDAWERGVLEKFETRKTSGEDPKKMEHHEVVSMNGKQVFRYMKAIPTAEKPCLACHGAMIKPQVAAALDKLYPNDQARGYKAGDIRGAFSIIQPM